MYVASIYGQAHQRLFIRNSKKHFPWGNKKDYKDISFLSSIRLCMVQFYPNDCTSKTQFTVQNTSNTIVHAIRFLTNHFGQRIQRKGYILETSFMTIKFVFFFCCFFFFFFFFFFFLFVCFCFVLFCFLFFFFLLFFFFVVCVCVFFFFVVCFLLFFFVFFCLFVCFFLVSFLFVFF